MSIVFDKLNLILVLALAIFTLPTPSPHFAKYCTLEIMADLVDGYPKKCFLCTNTLVSLDRTNNGHPLVRDEDIYIKRVCHDCNKFKVLPARGFYDFVFWYAIAAEQIKLFKELLRIYRKGKFERTYYKRHKQNLYFYT